MCETSIHSYFEQTHVESSEQHIIEEGIVHIDPPAQIGEIEVQGLKS